jgi:AcrR family transcriptional regulator
MVVRQANTRKRSSEVHAHDERIRARLNGRGRREPVQARSRRTVERILEAAEAIIGEDGVEAATTRAIAERAGVVAPSLYRFFDDRDAIFDALLEAMLEQLEEFTEEAERGFSGASIEDFVRLELDLHVAFYERHPSLARLWYGGRASPAVVDVVRARNQRLARRVQRALTEARLVDSATPELVFDLLVEYGDRTLEVAFRNGARGDRDVIDVGVAGLTAFAERWAPRDHQPQPKKQRRDK